MGKLNISKKYTTLLSLRTSLSLLVLVSAIHSVPAGAQFNQSIDVEGKYVPEIIKLDRIYSFPGRERFEMATTPLPYSTRSVIANFIPRHSVMAASGWRSDREIQSNRGYLELGAGSWLNSTLSAGYRIIQSEKATLGVRLQHNSTSLWKPRLNEEYADTKRWRYDEAAGIYGSYIFDDMGCLDAAADYHIGCFNYYGFAPAITGLPAPENIPAVPTQTLNDLSVRVGWQSESRNDDIVWNAAAGVRHFGYRALYTPEANPMSEHLLSSRGTRETDINICAGINFPISSKSAIGIDLNADILLYAGDNKENRMVKGASDYGMVTLTPYYRFSRDRLNIKIGAAIDITAGAGPEGNRYNAFHIAPDATLDYNAGPAQFYIHLLGGSRLNTLAAGYELDYYQQPWLAESATRPVYSPLDGSLGANFGPFGGFSAGAEFAFRVSKGEYLGGWYQARLIHLGRNAYPGLPATFDNFQVLYDYESSMTCDLHGYSVRVNLQYDLGRIILLKGKVNYQPQKGETGYFNGYDRARLTLALQAETNPWRALKLRLAYNYRGVRQIYTTGRYLSGRGTYENFTAACRLPDMADLNLGASYDFTRNFNVWIQADNLLNQRHIPLPSQPTPGICVTAGFGLLF